MKDPDELVGTSMRLPRWLVEDLDNLASTHPRLNRTDVVKTRMRLADKYVPSGELDAELKRISEERAR